MVVLPTITLGGALQSFPKSKFFEFGAARRRTVLRKRREAKRRRPRTTKAAEILAKGLILALPFGKPKLALAGVKAIGKALVPRTLKGALVAAATVPTAILVLKESPRAREALRFAIDPRKAPEKARIISGIIEDPSKLVPKEGETLKEKIIQAGKAAGLIGAVTAAAAGGLVVAGRVIKGKIPSLPTGRASQLPPIAFLPAPSSITPTIQPLGAVQKPMEPEKIAQAQPLAMPSIKITNKPEINISFRKSRRFINQQVIVK